MGRQAPLQVTSELQRLGSRPGQPWRHASRAVKPCVLPVHCTAPAGCLHPAGAGGARHLRQCSDRQRQDGRLLAALPRAPATQVRLRRGQQLISLDTLVCCAISQNV